MRPLVTLTTDFGEGIYVAQMKGVILSLVPDVRLIDVSHAVQAGDVREAAYALECAVPAFPEESVHVCVVDPGVGTDRKAIAVRFARRILIAPDNGVLTAFLAGADEKREITETGLFLPEVSATFHGRDMFAPVAAHLAGGGELAAVGPVFSEEPIVLPDLWATGREGVVLHVDRFGNVITSFVATSLEERPDAVMYGPDAQVSARARTFGEGPEGEPFLYAGSGGRVEIAIPGGSAAGHLGWEQGAALSFVGGGE